ncbi:hypothetical protein [Fusobacterium animalis]|uniref:Uncharacterized protein n=1 Tax=Fusobacterium animalis TaxID=76859 RepID=A0A0M5M5V7_9FUSO|nr:hypothetical protein [Fusobacterium animalis]ALF16956.1 hypothetical protein RN98_01635 [Fusobacterium animalis]
MVNKKMTMRDYYRGFITRANKEAGITYNASKLNSKEECEEYLLNLIKNLKHKKQDNKVYVKEINSLKEEIEILNNNLLAKNKEKANLKDKFEKLEAEKEKECYRSQALYWDNSYYEKDDKLSRAENLNFFFGVLIFVEALSIALLSWK